MRLIVEWARARWSQAQPMTRVGYPSISPRGGARVSLPPTTRCRSSIRRRPSVPSRRRRARWRPCLSPRRSHDYQFRVRLADLTGGGPTVGDAPVHAGLAPIGTCSFRRFIPPKALEITSFPPPPLLPAKPAASRTITKLVVARPFIGYPEAIFTGVPASTFQGANLNALIAAALANKRAIGVPDPDVDRFQVVVEAAIPDHDTGTVGTLPGDLDGTKWRIVYSVIETFPAASNSIVTLSLAYRDVPDIAAMTPPPDNAAALPIPTARDIRIRLLPLAAVKSDYYGAPTPPVGIYSDYVTRQEATSEAGLFPDNPPDQLSACFLRPTGNLPGLMAQSFGLTQNSLTFAGTPGERTVFAASGALRCSFAPDRSDVTLASSNELLNHWIVALSIELARDWTWDGFAAPAMTISRDGSVIGTLTFPTAVGGNALGDLTHSADRSTTRLVFLDAISPDPVPDAFPAALNPTYSVTASFPKAPSITQPPACEVAAADRGREDLGHAARSEPRATRYGNFLRQGRRRRAETARVAAEFVTQRFVCRGPARPAQYPGGIERDPGRRRCSRDAGGPSGRFARSAPHPANVATPRSAGDLLSPI